MTRTKPSAAVLAARERAWEHTTDNREEIERSTYCGCLMCRKSFLASAIKEWCDWEQTAMCPKCGTDAAVLGDASGFPVTDQKFLRGQSRGGVE
ncbi:MAG: hypothetical protein U1E50_02040 [Caulobacteraceae bacterium]